jgi:hypothetical protein
VAIRAAKWKENDRAGVDGARRTGHGVEPGNPEAFKTAE